MEPKDISSETWREYVREDGQSYRIFQPKQLFVSESGNHRVVDAQGVTHYCQAPGLKSRTVAIRWEAAPPVSF